MELGKITLNERTEIDANGRFKRYKEARFLVGETEHTLRISMPDFGAGKTRELVQQEFDLIVSAMGAGKK